MSTIYNTIQKAGGLAQDDFKIKVELTWDPALGPVATDAAADVMIKGSLTTSTDAAGRWTATVTANDAITPAGSVYKVTETQADGALSETYYIVVPDGDSWVGDILTSTPAWEA